MTAVRLHLAAFDGDNDAVNQLLTNGTPVDALTNEGETPLLLAATAGQTPVVRTLLKWGADAKRLPAQGNSALRRAINGGHAEIVRLLLARGADPEAVVPTQPPTAEEAAKSRELMRSMIEKMKAARNTARIAPPDPDEEGSTLDSLLDDSLFDNDTETTPEPAKESGVYRCLSLAILRDCVNTVFTVWRKQKSFQNHTILPSSDSISEVEGHQISVFTQPLSQNTETLRVLLEAGFSPIPAPEQKLRIDLLNFARSMGNGIEMARLLLEHGANPDGTDDENNPLLICLTEFEAPLDLIQFAIEKGALVNPSTAFADAPLMTAVLKNRTDVAEALLVAGAHPNGGLTKESPLAVARAKGFTNLAAVLEKHGASEEARQAAFGDLGDDTAPIFLVSHREPTSDSNPLARMPLLDFSKMTEQRKTDRRKTIVERRQELEQEVLAAESAA